MTKQELELKAHVMSKSEHLSTTSERFPALRVRVLLSCGSAAPPSVMLEPDRHRHGLHVDGVTKFYFKKLKIFKLLIDKIFKLLIEKILNY